MTHSSDIKTIGIWFGFPHEVAIKREGINRYTYNLVLNLMKSHDVNCEIWCYSENYAKLTKQFEAILTDAKYGSRLKVITERNFDVHFPDSKLRVPRVTKEAILAAPPELRSQKLSWIANLASEADRMIVPIIHLENALHLRMPTLVALHDLVIVEFLDSFLKYDSNAQTHASTVLRIVEEFSKKGAFFCSNSDFVRKEHLQRYAKNIQNESTDFVYLPVILPQDLETRLPSKKALSEKFNLPEKYIFIPTQIRPYKNIETAVSALGELREEGVDIKLVLTGTPNSEVDQLIRENHLESAVVLTGDLSEYELYAFHKFAVATVVPSLFEGGFPWQGLEAMAMGTPAIMAKIPVTLERLQFLGFDPQTCGLSLFEPQNVGDLVSQIKQVLSDRAQIVTQQEKIKSELLKYTWKEAGERYFQILNTKMQSSPVTREDRSKKQLVELKRILFWKTLKPRLKRIPVLSKVLTWIYQLVKMPGRVAENRDLNILIHSQLNQYQEKINTLQARIDQLQFKK